MKQVSLLVALLMTCNVVALAQKDSAPEMKVCIAIEASQPVVERLIPMAFDRAKKRVEDKKKGIEAVAMEGYRKNSEEARDLGCDCLLRIVLKYDQAINLVGQQPAPAGQSSPLGGPASGNQAVRNGLVRADYTMGDLKGEKKPVDGQMRSDDAPSMVESMSAGVDLMVEDTAARAAAEAMRLFRKKNKIK